MAEDRILISPHDGFMFAAHHAMPLGERKGGVVVLQEIFGLTDHIRDMCEALAACGLEALAPALFDRIERGFLAGMDAEGIQKGREAVADSPWEQVADDIQAAIDALAPPVFVVGFCYGAAAAWLAGARCRGVQAVGCFYGRLIDTLRSEPPKVPAILHFGAFDASIPPEMVDRVRSAAIGAPVYVYEAGHGFCRMGSPDFNAAARDLAMERTLELFDRATGH